jgi:hypothetical protein
MLSSPIAELKVRGDEEFDVVHARVAGLRFSITGTSQSGPRPIGRSRTLEERATYWSPCDASASLSRVIDSASAPAGALAACRGAR